MKTRMRRELQIGWIVFVLYLIINCFFAVHELVMGVLAGLSISFLIVGALPEKVYRGLKRWKKSFVK
ncbi:hypothetical protein [Clostridium sp. UBA6640]|uniref:hypothetical protein n=1 Tax=Clostridium sp. UBA6640 TaxID=1946370 RepID=UPI0025B8074A|nr:hypothetical protein [Clostridium sp. UBA6640]